MESRTPGEFSFFFNEIDLGGVMFSVVIGLSILGMKSKFYFLQPLVFGKGVLWK
jgi:hypothetical protein